jgi:murein endopeptidase
LRTLVNNVVRAVTTEKERDARIAELHDLRAQDSDEQRLIRATLVEVKNCDKQARKDADWLNKLKYRFAMPLHSKTRNRLTDIARRLRGNTK